MYQEINERCILNSFIGSSRFIYNLYLDKKDKMSNYKKYEKKMKFVRIPSENLKKFKFLLLFFD